MKWSGYVTHVREMRNAYQILVLKFKQMRWLEELGVDGRLIEKWTEIGYELDSANSVSGCCEHGHEPSGSIKGRRFLDHLSNCQFLRRTLLLVINALFVDLVSVTILGGLSFLKVEV